MPGLDPGTHVFAWHRGWELKSARADFPIFSVIRELVPRPVSTSTRRKKDVGGRVKPGHDGEGENRGALIEGFTKTYGSAARYSNGSTTSATRSNASAT